MVDEPISPSRIEYDLGNNMHGQPVKLFRENRRWILIRDVTEAREATAQLVRDETVRVELTDEQAAEMALIFGSEAA